MISVKFHHTTIVNMEVVRLLYCTVRLFWSFWGGSCIIIVRSLHGTVRFVKGTVRISSVEARFRV